MKKNAACFVYHQRRFVRRAKDDDESELDKEGAAFAPATKSDSCHPVSFPPSGKFCTKSEFNRELFGGFFLRNLQPANLYVGPEHSPDDKVTVEPAFDITTFSGILSNF